MIRRSAPFVLFLLLLTPACSDDSSDGSDTGSDAQQDIGDTGGNPDAFGLLGTDDSAPSVLNHLNQSNGEATALATVDDATIVGLVWDQDQDTLFGSDGSNLIDIDPETGASDVIGAFGEEYEHVRSLVLDELPSRLLGVNVEIGRDRLLRINTDTGEATFVGFVDVEGSVEALAWDPSLPLLYAAVEPGGDDSDDMFFTINPANGSALFIGMITSFTEVRGLAFDPLPGTLYGTDAASEELLTITPNLGVGTSVGETGGVAVIGLTFRPNL